MSASAFRQYTATDYGTLDPAYPLTINNFGFFSCTFFDSHGFDTQGIVTDHGGGEGYNGDGDFSAAYGLNNSNVVCGYWTNSSDQTEGAFLWPYPAQTFIPLPPYGVMGLAKAYAINDAGIVVGASATLHDFSDSVATIWTNQIPAAIPGMSSPSAAWAVDQSGNAAGQTAVFGQTGPQPFYYSGGVTTLLPLPSADYSGGIARAMSRHIVGAGNFGGIQHALLWHNGTVQDLGGLPYYPGDTWATGINASDEIVGTASDGMGNSTGFIVENGQMADLNSLLVGGWIPQIISARTINDSGQIVAFVKWPQNPARNVALLTPVLNFTGLSINPSTVQGGATTTGTVTIDAPAFYGGLTITFQRRRPRL